MNKKGTSKKRPVVARKVEPIVGRDLDSLLGLASVAIGLDGFLRRNCGHCDEWPIQIIASTAKDVKEARELCSLLVMLAWKASKVKNSGPAFRAVMGWEVRALK